MPRSSALPAADERRAFLSALRVAHATQQRAVSHTYAAKLLSATAWEHRTLDALEAFSRDAVEQLADLIRLLEQEVPKR